MRKESFDETFLQVSLKGGVLHTELLQVEATVTKGALKGHTLPLKCQWYNISKNNDFHEIEEVSGQFYQPCILDVGSKIMVQAIPILDSEYDGMPISKETHYLQIDQRVLDQAKVAYDVGQLEVNAKLENILGPRIGILAWIQCPFEIRLVIQQREIHILANEQKLEIQDCELRIIRKSNTQIELQCGETKLLIATASSLERDVIYQFRKSIVGKQMDPAQLGAVLADQEQKIKNYEQEIGKINEQNSQLRAKLKEVNSQCLNQQKKIEALEKLQQSALAKEKEQAQLKQSFEKLEGKNQFYQQELKVLKSEIVRMENQQKKQLQEIEELKKIQSQNQEDVREMIYREKIEHLRVQNEKCVKENQQWQLINDQLLKELKLLQNQIKQASDDKEACQNELNSLKKKYESLAREMSKPESASGSEIVSVPAQRAQEESSDEVKRLKQTISNLENKLKNLKSSYEDDMLKMVNGKQFIKQHNQPEIQVLQRLANSLAESLSDKELALQNQRNINKELLTKIKDFEQVK